MPVRFGLHLDGLSPHPPLTAVGEVTVGPQGLLRILETDLGLPPVPGHPAEQLVGYRGCLADLDSAERFYHRSFAVDPDVHGVAWRALLDVLGYELAGGVRCAPRGAPVSDLHALRGELSAMAESAEEQARPKTTLAGDGSFVVVRATSRDISARAIAETLHRIGSPAETVVIAEQDGIIVDNALERSALPRCGFQHYSRFRAVFQVLKLALAMLWQPLSPHLLLQFLIHPLGPVSSRIRARLAEAVAVLTGGGERAVFGAAVAQAEALMASLSRLQAQGHSTLGRIELDRLLHEVTREQPDPNIFAKAGHVRGTTQPGAITGNWSRVIWWDLAAHGTEVGRPWSAAELAELRARGVMLQDPAELLRLRGDGWLRPVANAVDQLILVIHSGDRGHHPPWSRIAGRFVGWPEVHIDDCLFNGDTPVMPALDVATRALPVTPLPLPRRWWELPKDSVAARPVESYSSLRKLFYHPHEWVLSYAARIRAGRAADLADGPLLYGNLAHRLFERFFVEHPSWQQASGAEVNAWLAASLPRPIAQEGAVLLEAGRGVDRQYLSTTLERALHRLIAHLRSARAVSVVPEHHEEQPYLDVSLRGDLDLLVTDDLGRARDLLIIAHPEKFSENACENAWLNTFATSYTLPAGDSLALPNDKLIGSSAVRLKRDGEALPARAFTPRWFVQRARQGALPREVVSPSGQSR